MHMGRLGLRKFVVPLLVASGDCLMTKLNIILFL